jgi:choline dehydrogenase-like flavoprotein
MAEGYDVIVIGTGAGGGTLARHLAPSGRRILLLERGDWLPREPAGHLARRCMYMKTDIPIAGCAHQAGTVRFGADPATSVLNADCRAHAVDNLYVADTSIFPSISAVNPALTAMANAIRVGDHILARLG